MCISLDAGKIPPGASAFFAKEEHRKAKMKRKEEEEKLSADFDVISSTSSDVSMDYSEGLPGGASCSQSGFDTINPGVLSGAPGHYQDVSKITSFKKPLIINLGKNIPEGESLLGSTSTSTDTSQLQLRMLPRKPRIKIEENQITYKKSPVASVDSPFEFVKPEKYGPAPNPHPPMTAPAAGSGVSVTSACSGQGLELVTQSNTDLGDIMDAIKSDLSFDSTLFDEELP